MSAKLTFLGTGCMIPTKKRNHLSVAFEYCGEIMLFDCGEATQHQIKKAKIHIGKITKIFISHWHGDHVLGLPGLLMTLSNVDCVEQIEIHGPKNSKKFVENMKKSTIWDANIKIAVFEHNPKSCEVLEIMRTSKYSISCSKLLHSVPCIGYSFKELDTLNVDKEKAKKLGLEKSPLLSRAKLGLDIEFEGNIIRSKNITYLKKGLKVSFVFDTRPCQEINMLVKDSDYLVMEATFLYEKHKDKAESYEHMSAKETAEIARENCVGTLFITHFSQRYKDVLEIEIEAKKYFDNVIVTYDLMNAKLK